MTDVTLSSNEDDDYIRLLREAHPMTRFRKALERIADKKYGCCGADRIAKEALGPTSTDETEIRPACHYAGPCDYQSAQAGKDGPHCTTCMCEAPTEKATTPETVTDAQCPHCKAWRTLAEVGTGACCDADRPSHETRECPIEADGKHRLATFGAAGCISCGWPNTQKACEQPSALPPAFQSLVDLEPNWDSYGAKRINLACIQKAYEIWKQLAGIWLPVPHSDGTVGLEQHQGGFDIEIDVDLVLPSQSEPV